MAEFGEKTDKDLPKVGSDAWEKLPKNARIALRRLRAADAEEELGLANSKYVEPREVSNLMNSDSAVPVVELIAAAILALKNSGVSIRRAEPIDAEVVTNPAVESSAEIPVAEEDADDDRRTKRFRRSRG